MNAEVMQKWTDKCFRTRPGAFFKTRSLLIFDSMAAHKESSVQRYIHQTGAHLAVIPCGLTKLLQPLDVSVNHPFKAFVREEWDKWMMSGQHSYTPCGRQRRATYAEVCKWVITAWGKVRTQTIVNGFRKCGILHDADESDGEDEDDDDSVASDSEPIADEDRQALVMDVFAEDSDDNESFNGFDVSYDDKN